MNTFTKEELGNCLRVGWHRYVEFFEEDPHGTLRQLLALLELSNLPELFKKGKHDEDTGEKKHRLGGSARVR